MVRVASRPRSRCWRAGFCGLVGRSVSTIQASQVFGRATRQSSSQPFAASVVAKRASPLRVGWGRDPVSAFGRHGSGPFWGGDDPVIGADLDVVEGAGEFGGEGGVGVDRGGGAPFLNDLGQQ